MTNNDKGTTLFTAEGPAPFNFDRIIDDRAYAAFLIEPNGMIAHQFGILTGATVKQVVRDSTCPERLEFHALD